MNFGFLLFNGMEELDLVGPWEMITTWGAYAGGPDNCLMIAETPEPVRCYNGMNVIPHATIDIAAKLDYLLVPGGMGTRKEVNYAALVDYVTAQEKTCKAILSVCTGAFILHAAGLLHGKRATTHWMSLNRLKDLGDVEVVEERVVKDGKIWTSSGVSAGIDLALAFIKHESGEDAAGKVQALTEYYPSGKKYGK
ncbi:MAG: DJ-1/PfpI family protein [Candidatus Tantalella remota]|nr:DJ-1/PfpI family protein [Candidatus Tantalella remota]